MPWCGFGHAEKQLRSTENTAHSIFTYRWWPVFPSSLTCHLPSWGTCEQWGSWSPFHRWGDGGSENVKGPVPVTSISATMWMEGVEATSPGQGTSALSYGTQCGLGHMGRVLDPPSLSHLIFWWVIQHPSALAAQSVDGTYYQLQPRHRGIYLDHERRYCVFNTNRHILILQKYD